MRSELSIGGPLPEPRRELVDAVLSQPPAKAGELPLADPIGTLPHAQAKQCPGVRLAEWPAIYAGLRAPVFDPSAINEPPSTQLLGFELSLSDHRADSRGMDVEPRCRLRNWDLIGEEVIHFIHGARTVA